MANTKIIQNPTPEQKMNRQINYSVIETLWELRKKNPKMDDATKPKFYVEMKIGKDRYRRILVMPNGKSPQLAELSIDLSKKTGVSQGIFFGDIAFDVNGISKEKWEDYCTDLKDSLNDETNKEKNKYRIETAIAACKQFEKELYGILDGIIYKRDVDPELYKAYMYFVYGIKVDAPITLMTIERIKNEMSTLSFSDLETLDPEKLLDYKVQLLKQAEMVETICKYKNFKKNNAEKINS